MSERLPEAVRDRKPGPPGDSSTGAVNATGEKGGFSGFIPTKKLVLLVFLAVIPLLLSFHQPMLRWLAIILDGVLGFLVIWDQRYATRARIGVYRGIKGQLNVGIENQVTIRLKNLTSHSWKLWGNDDVPGTFGVQEVSFQLELKPLGWESHGYRVVPSKRGRFIFGDIWVRVQGPLGLCWVERKYLVEQAVGVYPDLSGASRLLLASASRDLENIGLRKIRRDGFGSEFARLRDYVQGDSMRDVDWKATARRHRPVTRVRETERSQTMLICVDAGRTMAARVDTLTKLDYAINAALFLAFVALQNGDRVGVAIFSDGVRVFLPPDSGRRQYRRIVDVLYHAESALTFVDYQALFRELATRLHKRALVAVLTDLIDEEQAQSLVVPLQRMAHRHVPLCIALRDQAIEDLIRERPEEVTGVYRQAVALELLEERERLKARITRSGIQVVDSTPKDLSISAVNRYLEIKRRGLL